jgi:hydroxymethylbilane synthase
MPSQLPDRLILAAVPERADARDAFFGKDAKRPADLPRGAIVGTASLRRAAQILHLRPDLEVVPLRGNVETRLRKLADGQVDATLLAMAGLIRLGLLDGAATPLSTNEMLPAVAQGAIGIVCRSGDETTRDALQSISHPDSYDCVTAERGFLGALEGSCRTPIAASATCAGNQISLRGLVATPDGSRIETIDAAGSRSDADSLGRNAGRTLLGRLGTSFAQFVLPE